ncbi:hypothetical protein B0T25DRAFT_551907 [Lasiosphaeria hispida]|uniref:Uncharacterized protein n=1 Tax=Lasiosphaeria hispida TaxID=260671 RepID=A0AAJ0HBQ3_9PEZI|nr:hypothetical protein B0T25DRAFT_551907 [Lasiosphaeria hispida]
MPGKPFTPKNKKRKAAAAPLPGQPPAKLPKQANPGLGAVPQPPTFAGRTVIAGSRKLPMAAFATATAAATFRSTPDNIELNLFVDGSYDPVARTGAYAVVFKRFAPGSKYDGKLVEMAWLADPGVGSNYMENMAIAVGGVVAKIELLNALSAMDELEGTTETVAASTTAGRKRSAIVRIFSDGQGSFSSIKRSTGYKDGRSPGDRLIGVVADASFELQKICGLEVNLRLHWIPSHISCYEVREHKRADILCAQARKEGRSLLYVDGLRMELDPQLCLSDLLQGGFVKEAVAPSLPCNGSAATPFPAVSETMDDEEEGSKISFAGVWLKSVVSPRNRNKFLRQYFRQHIMIQCESMSSLEVAVNTFHQRCRVESNEAKEVVVGVLCSYLDRRTRFVNDGKTTLDLSKPLPCIG